MLGRFHHALALGATLALGCSDPVPPASRVGVRINVTGSGACPAGQAAPIRSIGNPAPNSQGIEGKGGPISDGEQGVSTSCSVTGGPQYNVSASARQGAVSFSLAGLVDGATGSGTATVTVETPDLAGYFQSGAGACTVTAVSTQQGVQVKPGAMWATFRCDPITGPIASEVCKVQGDLVIENCD